MAERTAPWLLDAVATGSQEARLFTESIMDTVGVVNAGDLAVTAPGGMNVSIASGRAFIRKTTAWQGMAHVVADSATTRAVTAANATNPRRDLVIAELTAASWQTRVVAGVAAATPVDPAVPVDCIVLARVTVPAAAAAITAAMIQDLRPWSMPFKPDPGLRNVLRNGDFTVWQRGVGPFTAPSFGAFTADGWKHANVGTSATTSASPQTPVYESTWKAAMRSRTMFQTVVTGGTDTSAQLVLLQQSIEGLPFRSGEQMVLTFVADVSVASTIFIETIIDTTGTLTGVVTPDNVKVELTPGVKRYTVNLKMPTYAGAGNPVTDSLRIMFWGYIGSTLATGQRAVMLNMTRPVGVTFQFAEVQLEQGPYASPFERMNPAAQLAWCQRYFQRWGGKANCYIGPGIALNTVIATCGLYFPVVMRTAPTMVATGVANFSWFRNGGASVTVGSIALDFSVPESARIAPNVGAGLSNGEPLHLYCNSASGYLDFSAEL